MKNQNTVPVRADRAPVPEYETVFDRQKRTITQQFSPRVKLVIVMDSSLGTIYLDDVARIDCGQITTGNWSEAVRRAGALLSQCN